MGSSPRSERAPIRKVVGASVVGTTLEWYDFFLFGSAAALVFPDLFFPESDPLTGTLLSFLTFAIGFGARPIGGLVFGHLGDRVGRKKVLVATLLIMGCATFAIGLLPTYETIGIAAPLLLVVLRFIQGFGLGGEWGGAVLMSTEHGRDRRGFYGSFVQAGAPAGNLLAVGVLAAVAALTTSAAFDAWGWRIPFLLSGVIVLVGLYIRRQIPESPLFENVDKTEGRARRPIVDVLQRYPRSVVIAMGARLAENVAFYIFTVFVLTYATEEAGVSKGFALNTVLIASAVHLVAIPAFGALSDRVGRRPLYLAGAVGVGVWAFAFFPLVATGSGLIITLAVAIGLLFHGLMYAPQAAFFSELFGTRVRYSGASIGYQLASIFAGALAPIIAVALLAEYGSSVPISIYMAGMALLTAVAVLVARETVSRDLADAVPDAVDEPAEPRFQREPVPERSPV